jgi:hypothetical protein
MVSAAKSLIDETHQGALGDDTLATSMVSILGVSRV